MSGRHALLLTWSVLAVGAHAGPCLNFTNVLYSNLGRKGPDHQGHGIRYGSAARIGERHIDMVVELRGDYYTYMPANANLNGRMGTFGRVNLRTGTSIDLMFKFYDAATGRPVTMQDIQLTFYNLGKPTSSTQKRLTLGEVDSFCLSEDTQVEWLGQSSRLTLTSRALGTNEARPMSPFWMTPDQEQVSVSVVFKDVEKIPVHFEVTGPMHEQGENLLFSCVPLRCICKVSPDDPSSIGCPSARPTPPPTDTINCKQVEKTMNGQWPEGMKEWCCARQGIGCEEKPPPCQGHEQEWAECHLPECEDCQPRDCQFSEWDEWHILSGCSGLCKRKRFIVQKNNECGQPCRGPLTETAARDSCMPQHCRFDRVDCLWSDWSAWSECPAQRQHQSSRTRGMKVLPANGGQPCLGAWHETRPCIRDSRVPCELGQWQEWTACSATCGGGWQAHMRRIAQESVNEGTPCFGTTRQTRPCNTQPCYPHEPCKMSHWSSWSECTEESAYQTIRRRLVLEARPGGDASAYCNYPLAETRGCPEKRPHGLLSCAPGEWAPWSECSASLDGQKFRRRSLPRGVRRCLLDEDSVLMEETAPCERLNLALGCRLSAWGEWSACSHRCGVGLTVRDRRDEGSNNCKSALSEVKACEIGPCADSDCKWNDWDQWSACSCPCGGGIKRRSRTVAQHTHHAGQACSPKDKSEVAPCNTQSCEKCIDGVWGPWNGWLPCSATCGSAVRVRHRDLAQRANYCGKPAVGLEDDFEVCKRLPYCGDRQDCRLSAWGPWSGCSSKCNGVHERTRQVIQFKKRDGKECNHSSLKEVEPCNPTPPAPPPHECVLDAPADCKLSPWEEWQPCTASCDGGVKLRPRRVLAPQRNGGAPCEGRLEELAACGAEPCESAACEDCVWSAWSEWGHCTQCGGQRYRHRSVLKMPNACGKLCDLKEAKQVDKCHGKCQKMVYCMWSEWNEGAHCSSYCGNSTRTRQRWLQAVENKPNEDQVLFKGADDTPCSGSQVDNVLCQQATCKPPCEPVDCQFAEWSAWSAPTCTGLCERDRAISQIGKCGGQDCNASLVETKRCERKCDEPEDCIFSDWGLWSHCRKDNEQRVRSRAVVQPQSHGGKPCEGPLVQTRLCAEQREPRDCQLADWQPWSSCSRRCGAGTRTRIRLIARPAVSGESCDGPLRQLEPCALQPCEGSDLPCKLDDWSSWSSCSRFGLQTRKRGIIQQPVGKGFTCEDTLQEVHHCTTGFVLDCIVEDWSAWDECDKSCGGGQQQRSRQIVQNPQNGGLECASDLVVIRGCNEQPCRASDARVSQWSSWTDCSHICSRGQKTRTRDVTEPREEGGQGFNGILKESAPCLVIDNECNECQDCLWSQWSEWTSCSRECNGGQRTRERHLLLVPEKAGCPPCEPAETAQIIPCNTMPCGSCRDGLWAEWSQWVPCSATCRGGVTWRRRSVAQHPDHCGGPLVGYSIEHASCREDVDCGEGVDCELAQWSQWSDCSQSCGGLRERLRRVAVHRAGDGRACRGPLRQVYPCAARPDCQQRLPVDCVLSKWSGWGRCRASVGQKSRSRSILVEGSNGGTGCLGTLVETTPCGARGGVGCTPLDCLWGSWRPWSTCSSCRRGQKRRVRHIEQLERCGGTICDPRAAEQIAACSRLCDENAYCVWAPWHPYGTCSATCGKARRSRMRHLHLVHQAETIHTRRALLDAPLGAEAALEKFEELRRRKRGLEVQRLRDLALAWAAGACSLGAVAAAVKACLRSRPRPRRPQPALGVRGAGEVA